MKKYRENKRHHIPVLLYGVFLSFFLFIMPVGAFAQGDPQAVLQLIADNDTVRAGDRVAVTLRTGLFENLNRKIRMLPAYLKVSFDGDIFVYEAITWHVDAESFMNHVPTDTEPYWSGNVETYGGLNENTPVFTLYLRIKKDAPEGNTDIHLSNNARPLGMDMQGNIVSMTYNDTSVQIKRPLTSDNTLHHLDLGGISLTPRFDPQIYQYTASVPHHVLSIPLYYEAGERAAVHILGTTDNLSVGENTVRLLITAEDGSRQEYRLVITRAYPTTPPTSPPEITTSTSAASSSALPSSSPSISRLPSSTASPSKPPGSSATTSASSTLPSPAASGAPPSHSASSPSSDVSQPSLSATGHDDSSKPPENTLSEGQPVITGGNILTSSPSQTAYTSPREQSDGSLAFDIRYLPILPLLLLILAVIVYLVRRNHHDSEPPGDDAVN